MSMQMRHPSRTEDRVSAYLRAVAHTCPGCTRAFTGDMAFLQFALHVDHDLVCRHEFESYLDQVRQDAGGA